VAKTARLRESPQYSTTDCSPFHLFFQRAAGKPAARDKLYWLFIFFGQKWCMNLTVAIRALNERAIREKWYHICDPSLAFSEPCYTQLLGLWRDKAGTRKMPTRSEMTFRDLKDLLRNILVLERVSQIPSRYKFRLVGTGLHNMAGELTGKMVDEVVPPEHLPRWVGSADLILDGGQPLRFVGRVHLEGKEYLNAENLYVPLANDNDEPTYIMGLCRYTPRRTDAEESWENQIASMPGALL
jgi:hypothetical protein